MKERHARFYDRAFGSDPAHWKSASPYYALTGKGQAILAVCSSRRADSCEQARSFVSKAQSLGIQAAVLQEDLTHKDINQRLGEKQDYTKAVDSFLAGLDKSVAKALGLRYLP